MNPPIVSVSLLAGLLHLGHFVFRNALLVRIGLPNVEKSTSSGNNNGRSFSCNGTMPHLSQYIIGIGVPQYLCLEISQSFSLYCTVLFPRSCFSIYSEILSIASRLLRPLKDSEWMSFPSKIYACSSPRYLNNPMVLYE